GWRRVEELGQEIVAREAAERSDRQHRESMTWQKRFGVIAIAVTILVAVGSLIYNTYISKVQRATSPQASPPSLLQTPQPTSVLPEPERVPAFPNHHRNQRQQQRRYCHRQRH